MAKALMVRIVRMDLGIQRTDRMGFEFEIALRLLGRD